MSRMGKSLRDAYRRGRGAPVQAPPVKPNRRSGLYLTLEVAFLIFHASFFAASVHAGDKALMVVHGVFLTIWSACAAAEIVHMRQRRRWRKPFGPI